MTSIGWSGKSSTPQPGGIALKSTAAYLGLAKKQIHLNLMGNHLPTGLIVNHLRTDLMRNHIRRMTFEFMLVDFES